MTEYAHGCSAQHKPGIACKHGPACADCMPSRCFGKGTTVDWRKPKAQHSSATSEHGTPPHIVEHGRRLMGGIDLDVASSAFWNRRVRATRFYNAKQNGLIKPWSGKVFCNPPGDSTGRLVQAFWLRLVEHYLAGQVEQAIWVGFSLEQFVTLQGIADVMGGVTIPNPLHFPTLIPGRRLHYQIKNGSSSKRSKNPPHASYITWLPPRAGKEAQALRFADEVGYLGVIVRTT